MAAVAALSPVAGKPWRLPARGLVVVHGTGEAGRLSHYFLPRLLMRGERVLFLDGANCANPRRIARFARERGLPFEQFSRRIQIARAFTCFQLTELTARVPRFLEDFPARVLMVTALPDLYFDEDVRDWDARVAFEQDLRNLRRLAELPLSVAVFSDARAFLVPEGRRRFFPQLKREANEVWTFRSGAKGRPELACERAPSRLEADVNNRGA